MALPELSVVYRSRVLQDAESLSAFLRRSGINTRLVTPRRIGHLGDGPVFDVLHDVYAADCTDQEVKSLITRWRMEYDVACDEHVPFCHFCGETLSASARSCPSCGMSLEYEAEPAESDG